MTNEEESMVTPHIFSPSDHVVVALNGIKSGVSVNDFCFSRDENGMNGTGGVMAMSIVHSSLSIE